MDQRLVGIGEGVRRAGLQGADDGRIDARIHRQFGMHAPFYMGAPIAADDGDRQFFKILRQARLPAHIGARFLQRRGQTGIVHVHQIVYQHIQQVLMGRFL